MWMRSVLLKMISLKHLKNGGLVLRKKYNSNFRLKICPVSLTSHLHMRAQPYVYKDGWNVTCLWFSEAAKDVLKYVNVDLLWLFMYFVCSFQITNAIAENYWYNWFFGLWTFRHRCVWVKCEEPLICQTEK